MNLRRSLVIAGLSLVLLFDLALLLEDTRVSAYLPSWMPEWSPPPALSPGERRIAAHWSYALALGPDDRLYGWGSDAHGALVSGRGPPVSQAVMLVDNVPSWRYVSAGTVASYAINSAGALLRRPVSALSPDASAPLPAYQPVFPRQRWIRLREVLGLTLALGADGRLYVWNERAFQDGQWCEREPAQCWPLRPDGTLVEPMAEAAGPAPPPAAPMQRQQRTADAPVRSLAWPVPGASDWLDFCVSADGEARRFRAYALNRAGQLWRVDVKAEDFEGAAAPAAQLTAVPARAPFQRVFCTEYAQGPVFLLDRRQRLWGFGDNRYGALWPKLPTGRDPQASGLYQETDLRRLSSRRWRTIAPGHGYSLGITSYGDLWAWGQSYDRDTGQQDSGASVKPVVVDAVRDWVEVDTAGGYLLTRDREGHIYVWGTDASAQDPAVRGLLGAEAGADHRDTPGAIVLTPRPAAAPSPPPP